jgi:DNA-binding transcriptional regulator YbjK
VTAKPAQESATLVANAVAESVQYQGRKASRQGSEQRRQAILDAAMRIIVRDGVRAVRHRAVAAEAQVPLSATTYYFKDIDDLITDTFAQFVERSAAHMGQFWSSTEGLLRDQVSRLDGGAEARRRLANEIARLAVEYVRQQLLTRREHLLAAGGLAQPAPARADAGSPADSAAGRDALFRGAGFTAGRAGCQAIDGDYCAHGVSRSARWC